MIQNRAAAMSRILASEGGLRVADSEPGGSSYRGVSLAAFAEWRASLGRPRPALADLEAMSLADTAAFYDWKVLVPVRFDDLPAGVDYALADFAVNEGVAGALDAARWLFGTQKVAAPWRMDGALFAGLTAPPAPLAVSALCDLRWALMQAGPGFAAIAKGRAFRASSAYRGAMELIGFPAMADRYQPPPLAPRTAAAPSF